MMTMRSNKLLPIFMVFGLIGVGVYAWLQTGQPTNSSANALNQMNEVNNLLNEARIEADRDWRSRARCGPRDEFIGYYISYRNQGITGEQATELKRIAEANDYQVDEWGKNRDEPRPSYSLNKDEVQIRVMYNTDDSEPSDTYTPSLSVDIPVDERPTELQQQEATFCG